MVEGTVHHPDVHEDVTQDDVARRGIKVLREFLDREREYLRTLEEDPTLTKEGRLVKRAEFVARESPKATRQADAAYAELGAERKAREAEIEETFRFRGEFFEGEAIRAAFIRELTRDPESGRNILRQAIDGGDHRTVAALLSSKLPAWVTFGPGREAERDLLRRDWARKAAPGAVARIGAIEKAQERIERAGRAFVAEMMKVEAAAQGPRAAVARRKAAEAGV